LLFLEHVIFRDGSLFANVMARRWSLLNAAVEYYVKRYGYEWEGHGRGIYAYTGRWAEDGEM
jgi:hypothetical protein